MWILSAVFLVLWLVSVNFYAPVLLILALFAGMLITAGLALTPTQKRNES